MRIIVGIISSRDEIYNKFKNIWINSINNIKSTNLGINYEFYFIYNESNNEYIHKIETSNNYTDYTDYTDTVCETGLIEREVRVLNKVVNFFKYIKHKLNLSNNESYNYNTDENTTYILRTNLSSLFDFVKLYNFLLNKPKKCFLAGTINGFYNNINTTVSGMNLILSLDLMMYCVDNMKYMMEYLKQLRYEDDTMSNYLIKSLNVYMINIKRLDFIEMEKVVLPTHIWPATPKSIIYQKCKIYDDSIFSFRFKTFSRENDINTMNMLNNDIATKEFNLNNFVNVMSTSFGYLINTESEDYGEMFSNKIFKIV